jgi:hypothetical protein
MHQSINCGRFKNTSAVLSHPHSHTHTRRERERPIAYNTIEPAPRGVPKTQRTLGLTSDATRPNTTPRHCISTCQCRWRHEGHNPNNPAFSFDANRKKSSVARATYTFRLLFALLASQQGEQQITPWNTHTHTHTRVPASRQMKKRNLFLRSICHGAKGETAIYKQLWAQHSEQNTTLRFTSHQTFTPSVAPPFRRSCLSSLPHPVCLRT